MDELDQKALNNIVEYGCHVTHVYEGGGHPSFTYSIGINKTQNKPDVVIFGLKAELAHMMVNNYNKRLLEGEILQPGGLYPDFIGNFDVCFIKVSKQHYEKHFGFGLWLHEGDDFEMLQMVWPTTRGAWPWDKELSDFYKYTQPILNDKGLLNSLSPDILKKVKVVNIKSR